MWLLENNAAAQLQAAIDAGVTPSAEQQAQFEATQISAMSDGPRILKAAGNTAEIAVNGVLTNKPNFMAMFFGGGNTTYPDIVSAIGIAEQDPNVEKIDMMIDSPGGEIAGLFALIDVINSAKKPINAIVSNTAASAAYAIASSADKIIAKNNSARFGSIGIVVDMRLDANKVSITSTNAPNKRPDISTEEGKAVVRAELDDVHSLFAAAIASGRNTTVDKVNTSFGQGGMFLADEALKRGMIDSIAKTSLQSVKNTNQTKTAAIGGDNSKVKSMDLATLKAEHPEAYAAAVKVGRDEGITVGVTQERDRVNAHLIMGESSGDMKTALAACKDGAEMTSTMQSTYLSAGMNRSDTQARDDDDAAVGAAGNNANAEDDTAETDAEAVVGALEERFGTEVK
ncbi:MAG: S49 family peptidase [Proteobacteria bacterium]|nr:S49 family peptidase [Pseudomonadota bacterium]